MNEVKVMSFNLRIRVEADGANFFDLRCPKILSVIERESPDVIGFQEANDVMLEMLMEGMTDYVFLGHGRESGYCGEGVFIAYKKNRFYLHGFREEWLSMTPTLPNSRIKGLDQSGCPRVYCCAELVDRETKKPFAFYNVHLDHKGRLAQVAECMMLCQRIAEGKMPFVLTGDFNARPEQEAIGMILGTQSTLGTIDATSEIAGTFHNFSMERIEQNNLAKIDYIFTNLPTDPARSYAIPDDNLDGCFYSDHNAVCAFVNTIFPETENE